MPLFPSIGELRERLRQGAPPLRISEFVRITGYSEKTVRKLIDAQVVETVGLTEERRIPADEALRVARELRIIRD